MGLFDEFRRSLDAEKDAWKKSHHGDKVLACRTCIDYFRINNPHVPLEIRDRDYPFHFVLVAHGGDARRGIVFENINYGYALLHAHATGKCPDIAHISDVSTVDPYMAYPNCMASFEESVSRESRKITVNVANVANVIEKARLALLEGTKRGDQGLIDAALAVLDSLFTAMKKRAVVLPESSRAHLRKIGVDPVLFVDSYPDS